MKEKFFSESRVFVPSAKFLYLHLICISLPSYARTFLLLTVFISLRTSIFSPLNETFLELFTETISCLESSSTESSMGEDENRKKEMPVACGNIKLLGRVRYCFYRPREPFTEHELYYPQSTW